jgi:CubicO group peptidase (beta-lactamase class C family)
MAGTAAEILAFLEALRQRGGAILKPDTVALAVQNQIGDLPRRDKDTGKRFGFLGAVLDDPAAAASPQARGTINWGGIYGHSWFVDLANGLTAVMLTNTAVEGCTGRYPDELRDAIYGV